MPDVRVYKLSPGVDKFLVIASDGLWGMMTVEEVVNFVHNFNEDDHLKGEDVSHWYELYSQRSKLTFTKSRPLATFNFKMIAIKNKKSVAKKNLKERAIHDTLLEG